MQRKDVDRCEVDVDGVYFSLYSNVLRNTAYATTNIAVTTYTNVQIISCGGNDAKNDRIASATVLDTQFAYVVGLSARLKTWAH